MMSFTKTKVPEDLLSQMEPLKNDDEAVRKFATNWLTNFCKDLIQHDHRFLHFYTMNLEKPVIDIMNELGIVHITKELPFKKPTF